MVALGVVALILLALTLDFAVERLPVRASARISDRVPAWLDREVPAGTLLDPAHVWLRREAGDQVRVGGDGFAAALLGKPERVEVPAGGDHIDCGEPLAVLSRQGRSITLRSPVSGVLVERNALIDAQVTATDPFGSGWLAVVRPANQLSEEGRVRAEQAHDWLSAEWERIRDFVLDSARGPAVLGATMPDGGPLQPGFLVHVQKPAVRAVENAFFGVAGPVTHGEGL